MIERVDSRFSSTCDGIVRASDATAHRIRRPSRGNVDDDRHDDAYFRLLGSIERRDDERVRGDEEHFERERDSFGTSINHVEENDAGFDDENDERVGRFGFNGVTVPLRDGDVDGDREGGEDEHFERELSEAGFAPEEDDEDFGDNIDEARANEPESDEEDILEEFNEAMNEERARARKRVNGDRISSRDGALAFTRGPYVNQAGAYSALKELSLHDGHSKTHVGYQIVRYCNGYDAR